MAGDWIKLEHATADKPEVGRIADRLNIDHDAAFGKVVRFWVWADQQAVAGNSLTVTKSAIDRVTYCPGFADALLEVHWLQARSGSFAIPRFDRHNGQSAKQRAETNRRVADHRKRNGNGGSVTDVTDDTLRKPLPEKRREEKKQTPTPLQIRVGKLLNRRETTLWSKKEIAALKEIGEPEEEDLQLLEHFYFARIPADVDYRRTALLTLLNNWNGEIDKARFYKLGNP